MEQVEALRPKRKKITIIMLTVVASVTILTLVVAYYLIRRPADEPSPIPEEITKQVSFPLYFPANLPEGYVIDQDIELNEGVVIININPPSGFKIYLTQQPVPSGFNYEDFKTEQILIDSSFSTPIGEVILGVRREVPIASLYTQQVWIFMSTNAEQASKAEFETIIRSLQPVKNL